MSLYVAHPSFFDKLKFIFIKNHLKKKEEMLLEIAKKLCEMRNIKSQFEKAIDCLLRDMKYSPERSLINSLLKERELTIASILEIQIAMQEAMDSIQRIRRYREFYQRKRNPATIYSEDKEDVKEDKEDKGDKGNV